MPLPICQPYFHSRVNAQQFYLAPWVPFGSAKLPSGTLRGFPQRVCRESHRYVAQRED